MYTIGLYADIRGGSSGRSVKRQWDCFHWLFVQKLYTGYILYSIYGPSAAFFGDPQMHELEIT